MSFIRTPKTYKSAKAQLEANRALLETETSRLLADGHSPEHAARLLRALQLRIIQLTTEISTYEALARGNLSILKRPTLGQALIGARIARQMSQADLARATRINEAQLARHEANEYATAGMPVIQKIKDAVGLREYFALEPMPTSSEERIDFVEPSVKLHNPVIHELA